MIEGLVMKVSKGGSGNWGSMPMPANDPSGTKQAEITELIKFEQGFGYQIIHTALWTKAGCKPAFLLPGIVELN